MADTNASGVIAHQDYGTGLADGENRDPTNAAFFAAGDNVASQYVQSGLEMTPDYGSDTVDISAGTAILEYSGPVGVTLSPTDDPADYSSQWRGPVAFPVSVEAQTGIPLTAAAPNDIILYIDETSNDSIAYRTGYQPDEPAGPSLLIGHIDTAERTVDEFNRSPDMTMGDATVENNLSVQGQADEQGNRLATRPWVNNNADVPNSDHADTAGDADTVDGNHASDLGGSVEASETDDGSDITEYRLNRASNSGETTHTVVNVSGSGTLLGGTHESQNTNSTQSNIQISITVDGGTTYTINTVLVNGSIGITAIPPVKFENSLLLEVTEQSFSDVGAVHVWVKQ